MEDSRTPSLEVVARAALDAIRGSEEAVLVRRIQGPDTGGGAPGRILVRGGGADGSLGDATVDRRALALAARALADGAPASEILDDGGWLFAQPYRATDRLVIAGGGHIAVELAALCTRLGFRVLVLEDRPEFVEPARFGPGVEARLIDFSEAFAHVPIDVGTYLVLVTRGHEHDLACLKQLLAKPTLPAYVGLIGSQRRVRAAFLALRNAGIADPVLRELYAPIGLDIGAETPAEIAVAIAAELIAVRRGATPSGSLRERARVLDRLKRDG